MEGEVVKNWKEYKKGKTIIGIYYKIIKSISIKKRKRLHCFNILGNSCQQLYVKIIYLMIEYFIYASI